jgi:hypothetical protein
MFETTEHEHADEQAHDRPRGCEYPEQRSIRARSEREMACEFDEDVERVQNQVGLKRVTLEQDVEWKKNP